MITSRNVFYIGKLVTSSKMLKLNMEFYQRNKHSHMPIQNIINVN